jgi:hypothetical protein
VVLKRNPNKSTRRVSADLEISRRSLQRILHSDLYIFPYEITVMHKLTAIDKERRLEFALWAMEEEAVLHNTWFTDEAYFHLNGFINNKTFDSGRGNFLTHCMRKKSMEQKLMCGPQFQPTESSVHFDMDMSNARVVRTASLTS